MQINEDILQILIGQKTADHVERLLGAVLRHHVTGCKCAYKQLEMIDIMSTKHD